MKKLARIQIAEAGKFEGHPAGPFELNDEVFSQICRNFAKDAIDVPVDWEHSSEADSASLANGGAPAAGWVKALENRSMSLWAHVEWLPKAEAQIRAGEYRFCSPAVRFGAKDRVTGKPIGARLTSVGLSNEPFLKSMEPLSIAAFDHGVGDIVRCPSVALPEPVETHPISFQGLQRHLMSSRGLSSAAAQVEAASMLTADAAKAALTAEREGLHFDAAVSRVQGTGASREEAESAVEHLATAPIAERPIELNDRVSALRLLNPGISLAEAGQIVVRQMKYESALRGGQ